MAGTVDILVSEGICTITLVGVTDQNPMSHALELAIIRACSDANADDKVKAIVFTGGPGKSFCAGGDFNEVAAMTTDAQVDD
jgi:enoyl-CoA hydratase/carnithine racemase